MTALIVTVVDGGSFAPEAANTLAYWGYRVLYVGEPAELAEGSRLGTARAVVQVQTDVDWECRDELEEIRDEWLADYDVVLIDGMFFDTEPDSPVCYQMPDLVILSCRLDDAGARYAQRTVDRWTYLRDLLPVDRQQLLVVPTLVPGDEGLSRSALNVVGQLCRNWSDTSVPIAEILLRLTGPSPNQLVALIAHRLARTDLLLSEPRGYLAAARKAPTFAYANDVVVVRDAPYQLLATQLERSLRGARLRVPKISPFELDSATRAVCVLAGPETTDELANYVRRATQWDSPAGPLPVIITALLPGARPLTLEEPLRSSEWIRLEPDRRHLQEAAQQVATLLGR